MPIPFISNVLWDGLSSIPFLFPLLKVGLTFAIIYLAKLYFSGATNPSERVLHGKVAIITGGTSGIGGAVALAMAQRGCQLVLLTRHPLSDPFLVDYIEDMRTRTGNELIAAEQVDLASLHDVRKFATRWIDNTPPRRLDMLVLCGDEWTPPHAAGVAARSRDGVDRMLAVNYLANFHLLSILSPALRAQPGDRDVRVVVGMCASYLGGDLTDLVAKAKHDQSKANTVTSTTSHSPPNMYAATKLALLAFSAALQKHFSSTPRPDGLPSTLRVLCVDPGYTRTSGMLRFLTRGSLLGLLFYIVTYPLWWLLLKSPAQGAQSFLFAAMDAQFFGTDETKDLTMIKECKRVRVMKEEVVNNEELQKKLWQGTEELIQSVEKESAMKRAQEKAKEKTEGKSKKPAS